MYNRYTQYHPQSSAPPRRSTPPKDPPKAASLLPNGLLQRLSGLLRFENVDTGDLILLALLFLLLEEKADEELIIALGLLLIL